MRRDVWNTASGSASLLEDSLLLGGGVRKRVGGAAILGTLERVACS